MILILSVTSLTSCSAPKTTVRIRNNAEGTNTSINVRNGEGSSTTVSVNTPVSLDSLSFKFENNEKKKSSAL